MGLETATYIGELDPSWPLGTDPKSQGDDHIRLIKETLQNTFPGLNSAVSPLNTRGYIDGFQMSNSLVDDVNDIVALTGSCLDSTNSLTITADAPMTKRIDASWIAGSDQGGFPTGLSLTADTWYHYFVIGNAAGDFDYGFDSDLSAVSLLADAVAFTNFRRIGSIYWDSSPIIRKFTQRGDFFAWDQISVHDINNATPGSGQNIAPVSVPLGVAVIAQLKIQCQNNLGSKNIRISQVLTTNPATDATNRDLLVNTASPLAIISKMVITDKLQQIRYRFSDGSDITNFQVSAIGWRDYRGTNE